MGMMAPYIHTLPKDFSKQFTYNDSSDFGLADQPLNLLISEEGEWYIAQGLEYDIVAQAKTIEDVIYEWQRLILSRICIGKELGIDPFEGLVLEG